MNLVSDFPITYCLVRNEFLYDQDPIMIGRFTEAAIIGIVALEGRAPLFTVMLRNGALWARLPLHALTFERNVALPLSTLCLWDCLSYDVTVHQYAYLQTLRADVFCADGVMRPGRYLATLDWCKSDYSEMPDQHKQHHLIVLDGGHLAAYPGNRLRWPEPSWIKPFTEKPAYKVVTTEWTTERDRALVDADRWAYGVVRDPAA
jgi:hypothetical protein